MNHPRRFLIPILFVSAVTAASAAQAMTVTFDFLALGDHTDRGTQESFTQQGLTVTLHALDNHVLGGNSPTLTSGGAFGVDGIGVNTGPNSDATDAAAHTIDSGSDDEAVEFSFDQPLLGLRITLAGLADFEIFSANSSELQGGVYVNGTGDGDKYGDGFDEDTLATVGNNATGAVKEAGGTLGNIVSMPPTPGSFTLTFANPAKSFFLVTASDSGAGHLVIQEIVATVVPVPAALPMIASALAVLGLARGRRLDT